MRFAPEDLCPPKGPLADQEGGVPDGMYIGGQVAIGHNVSQPQRTAALPNRDLFSTVAMLIGEDEAALHATRSPAPLEAVLGSWTPSDALRER
ncbi:hypothetical protein [Actinomadura sp. NTSP31]|uniref:hypothetical protein n=1 Tax=Actinomadura sp. NTSP31 TaxID=1735447 RepID=UPI0035C240FF